MDLIFIGTSGFAGLGIGVLIPEISNRIIDYKIEKNNMDMRRIDVPGKPIKIACCILNGLVWATAGFLMQDSMVALLISVLITLAVLFALIDMRIQMIPNELLLATLFLGLLFQFVYFGGRALFIALVCMLIMMVLFTLVGAFVGMDKVGAGDVKLAGVMGAVLGYPGIAWAALVMSLSFMVYSFMGILLKRVTLYSMLPFAPFMMLGLVASLGWILWVG